MIPWLELLDLNKWPYEEIEDLKYDAVNDMQVQDYDEDAEEYDEDIDSLNNNPSSADANSIPIVFEDEIDEDKAPVMPVQSEIPKNLLCLICFELRRRYSRYHPRTVESVADLCVPLAYLKVCFSIFSRP